MQTKNVKEGGYVRQLTFIADCTELKSLLIEGGQRWYTGGQKKRDADAKDSHSLCHEFQQYGLRGTPLKQLDIGLEVAVYRGAPRGQDQQVIQVIYPLSETGESQLNWRRCKLDIGVKYGRFDGNPRPRITISMIPSHMKDMPVTARLVIDQSPGGYILKIPDQDGSNKWADRWMISVDRLRADLDPTQEPAKIINWHYTRYFTHLRSSYDADVQALILSWRPSEGADLATANREASQALYDLSKALGWRKLTLREKRKLGLSEDSPQWHRADLLYPESQPTTDFYASYTPAKATGPASVFSQPKIEMARRRPMRVRSLSMGEAIDSME